MTKFVMGLPDKSIEKHSVAMAQMGGTKRAGDIHKEMVENFDAYQARMTDAVNEEIKRSTK